MSSHLSLSQERLMTLPKQTCRHPVAPNGHANMHYPVLAEGAWQEHGIVAPASALESTAPTSSRDRFSQRCVAMASQLLVVNPPLVAISGLFAAGVCTIKNLQHHENCRYFMFVRIMRWLAPLPAPSSAKDDLRGGDLNLARGDVDACTAFFAPLHVPQPCA
jgi:hypothetical protein